MNSPGPLQQNKSPAKQIDQSPYHVSCHVLIILNFLRESISIGGSGICSNDLSSEM